MFKKRETAEEFLRRLDADPEYVRLRAAQDAELAKLTAFYREAEAPLIDDLAALGVYVWSVWDLVNNDRRSYGIAIPLLLDHLKRPYPDAIRDGIARALGTPAARPMAWKTLVEEYRRTPARISRVKDGLAAALANASDDSVLADLIDLARDKQNGDSRVILLLGIRRSKRSEAKQAIVELANDPELVLEIASWRKSRKRSR
jgi:hypothetical protein